MMGGIHQRPMYEGGGSGVSLPQEPLPSGQHDMRSSLELLRILNMLAKLQGSLYMRPIGEAVTSQSEPGTTLQNTRFPQ